MSDTVIISVDKELDPIKQKNFLLSVFFISFIWMLFHFAVVFFFTLQLKSLAMIGIFLGIGNIFAFLFDVPIGIIQNYFKPKHILIVSCVLQILVFLIFSNFIFQVTDSITLETTNAVLNADGTESIASVLILFLGNGFNIVLLLIAAILYGIIKELQEVTIISYILNNSNPGQYGSIFAKKNIALGLGSFFGLFMAGIILSVNPKLIILSILIIILIIIFITSKFFDSSENIIDFKDINKFKVFLDKDNFSKENISNATNSFKNYLSKTIDKIELKDVVKNSKYIFMKPFKYKTGLNFSFLLEQTKKDFSTMFSVIVKGKNTTIIYWSISMLLTFGFWDTFASTFLIQFLDYTLPGWSYMLLGIIAIPAFLMQGFFSNLALKYGNYAVANLGLFLSGISLFLMGFLSSFGVGIVLVLGIINSMGYAACIILSQSLFLVSYNKSYAEYSNLKDIDSNAASAPMKILQNFANVIGLFIGGIVLGIFGYIGFFILFSLIIFSIFVWSFINKLKIKE